MARRWRRVVSLGLGLPLLLGSPPAAAASAGAALIGSLTTSIGVLAALWTVLGPRVEGSDADTALLAALAAVMVVSALWAWRHPRGRIGTLEAAGPAVGAPTRAAVAAVAAPPRWPSTLDATEVLAAVRARFLALQSAWDAGDVHLLRQHTTPEMLEQLLAVLGGRGGAPNRTDVITLHAELVGIEEVGAAYLASVEFSGLIRESDEAGAAPFRELWLLSSDKGGSPVWRLARQQALF